MKRGIYQDLPFTDYLKIEAASNSGLSELLRSPAHCKHKLDHSSKDTGALQTGRDVHTLVLEPETNDLVRSTGSHKGREPWKSEYLEHGDKLRKPSDYDEARRIADAVLEHPIASAIIKTATSIEASIFWQHPSGQALKGRVDILNEKNGYFADLKTTRDASARAFQKSMFEYGYHRQGAMYRQGLKELGIHVDAFAILAVETSAPYGVAVYELDADTLDYGWRQLEPLIETFAMCSASDHWPSYGDDLQSLTLSKWQIQEIENSTPEARQEEF